MLSTTITVSNQPDYSAFDIETLSKVGPSHYQITLSPGDKPVGDIHIADGVITLQYSSELSLDDYRKIHQTIHHISSTLDGDIDDSKSFLGYLPDGDSVYINKNWDKWVSYINQTMKKCQTDYQNNQVMGG